jgi:hypothetical protein
MASIAPSQNVSREDMIKYLTLLAKENSPPHEAIAHEVNTIAPQLIQELRRCREVKDTYIVQLTNQTSRQRQWNLPNLSLELATLIGTCAQLYNGQNLQDPEERTGCAYYAQLRPLVTAIVSHKQLNPLLSTENGDLLMNTCRYFLLGQNWAGIDRETVRVRYIPPQEAKEGCWEVKLDEWNYPFKLKISTELPKTTVPNSSQ